MSRYLHRRCTGYVSARMRATGHRWQGRFSPVAMDEAHLVSALRDVALNPVRAGLTGKASDWRWSSARARIAVQSNRFANVAPALARVGDFAA